MAERGAVPQVPVLRRRALHAMRSLFTPLLPDDYLELINPLWSTQELRGRIERIVPETPDAVTVLIRPGHEWRGHRPGQYLRIGVVVDGVHHWRAYSLTTDPVRLGGVEGTFVLPRPVPAKLLFISAGSGITPIMSMLRSLDRPDAVLNVVHIHSARTAEGVIFGDRLADLDARRDDYRLHLRVTGIDGRVGTADLDSLCPDWRVRQTFASGPRELLDTLTDHWLAEGDPELLAMERFQPMAGAPVDAGQGGRIAF